MKLYTCVVSVGALALACLATPTLAFQSYKNKCNSPNYVCVVNANGQVLAYPRNYVRQTSYKNRYQNPQYRHTTYKKNRHSDEEAAPAKQVELPSKIDSGNIINVDLGNLTWGAYDDEGNLLRQGHVSGGKKYCPDIGRGCRTVTGTFTVYTKKGADCKSKKFPVGKGGAPMPYCMFFSGGYALHGSNSVPNYNASHGCVRMSPADAQWLNLEFVRVGSTKVSVKY